MKFHRVGRGAAALAAGLLVLGLTGLLGQRQATVASRLPGRITGPSVRIPNSVHPRASRAQIVGHLDESTQLDRMQLVLKSSPEQNAELEQLIAEQHDPSSPRYQQWLTPEQFGTRFGPSDDDLRTVTGWLEGQGFRVDQVAAGRRSIEFSGTSGQVERAFHTSMNRVLVDGEEHIANTTEIELPSDLTAAVEGTFSLHDFRTQAHNHLATPRGSRPEYNANGGHALVPYDFATIYDVKPLWSAGTDGTGQSIAVIARTNIKVADVTTFRSNYGLPANPPQIVLNGPDPGIVSGDDVETDLDTEWAGGVARGATIKVIVSQSTRTSDGVDLSDQYAVNNNAAPIITLSYGACEASMGSYLTFYNSLWQQAAAQGQSVFVSEGDSGSAGCDSSSATQATQGFGINGLGSSIYNVAVGATAFQDGSASTYWNSSNDSTGASAKSYIPEAAWNESGSSGLWSTGGGNSISVAAPSFQASLALPAGGVAGKRWVPDVALSGAGHDAYVVIHNGGVIYVSGTSASTPSFAGIMALIDQRTGARNGNPNPKLYSVAAATPAAFHDVTTGSNAVPCKAGSPNCTNGKLTGFNAGVGYDLTTGLGSVDAYALANAWVNAPVPLTITSLSPNPMQGASTPQTLTITGSGFKTGMSLKIGSTTIQNLAPNSAGTSVAVSVIVGTAAATLPVQLVNGSSSSNTVNLTVLGPPPTITSLSPNPMTGASSPQTLTISGTGFVNGMIVNVGTLPTQVVNNVASATQLSVQVNVGTSAATLPVTVTNPSNQTSNSLNLTVNAPAVGALTITSLSPSTMTGSNSAQNLTIAGTGFVNGMSVKVGSTTISNVTPTSSTSLTVPVTVGTTATTLSVTVSRLTPAATSNALTLTVTAPTQNNGPPTITSLAPNPFPGSNSFQILTITGTNFRNNLTLKIGTAQATFNPNSSTSIVSQLLVGTTARTLPVQIVNADGTSSAAVNLVVTAPSVSK